MQIAKETIWNLKEELKNQTQGDILRGNWYQTLIVINTNTEREAVLSKHAKKICIFLNFQLITINAMMWFAQITACIPP